MKILIMCEGKNEETLVNILLDNNKLKFTRDDLIGLRPYNIRQLKHPLIKTELKHYNESILIYRIGDKQNDKLVIPLELKRIISNEDIYKYCTKPELEILLIIHEKLLKDFNKSNRSAKSYAKDKIKVNGKKYDQSSIMLERYYSNCDDLVNDIIEYKRIKKDHKQDELYLSDLLK